MGMWMGMWMADTVIRVANLAVIVLRRTYKLIILSEHMSTLWTSLTFIFLFFCFSAQNLAVEGHYTLHVTATDTAGNIASSARTTWFVGRKVTNFF